MIQESGLHGLMCKPIKCFMSLTISVCFGNEYISILGMSFHDKVFEDIFSFRKTPFC